MDKTIYGERKLTDKLLLITYLYGYKFFHLPITTPKLHPDSYRDAV